MESLDVKVLVMSLEHFVFLNVAIPMLILRAGIQKRRTAGLTGIASLVIPVLLLFFDPDNFSSPLSLVWYWITLASAPIIPLLALRAYSEWPDTEVSSILHGKNE